MAHCPQVGASQVQSFSGAGSSSGLLRRAAMNPFVVQQGIGSMTRQGSPPGRRAPTPRPAGSARSRPPARTRAAKRSPRRRSQGDARRAKGTSSGNRQGLVRGKTAILPDGARSEVVASVVYYVAGGPFFLPQRGRAAGCPRRPIFPCPPPGACARAGSPSAGPCQAPLRQCPLLNAPLLRASPGRRAIARPLGDRRRCLKLPC
jgi:hypothetical protein